MMRSILLRGAFFALIWWVLTEGRADSWDVGVVVLAFALVASFYLIPPRPYRLSFIGLLVFIGYFLVESLRGGVHVTAMALQPRMADLTPALLYLPLRLPPGPAMVLLASSISLMPGTLSVRLDAQGICLHVLDKRLLSIEKEIRAFEDYIARMFKITL